MLHRNSQFSRSLFSILVYILASIDVIVVRPPTDKNLATLLSFILQSVFLVSCRGTRHKEFDFNLFFFFSDLHRHPSEVDKL